MNFQINEIVNYFQVISEVRKYFYVKSKRLAVKSMVRFKSNGDFISRNFKGFLFVKHFEVSLVGLVDFGVNVGGGNFV